MATKPTISNFKTRFPEFNAIADANAQSLIDRAFIHHSATTEGVLLAAAHLHCLDSLPNELDGGAGVVSKESLGSKSVEYMTNAGGNERRAFWATSKYGRELLLIEQRNLTQNFGFLFSA